MHSQYFTYLKRNNSKLASDVAKAIDGEYSAIACYKQLSNLASTQKSKNVINEIRNDEIRHFGIFNHIYNQLTGHQYNPKIKEQCPNDYRRGIDFAFNDEQKTVDFYLEIADKTNDPYIKSQFSRVVMDEQNHAVWFLYLLK